MARASTAVRWLSTRFLLGGAGRARGSSYASGPVGCGRARRQRRAPAKSAKAAARVAAIIALVARAGAGSEARRSRRRLCARTVAVLPFRNAGVPEDAYVAASLTEEMIDALSVTRGLRVPPVPDAFGRGGPAGPGMAGPLPAAGPVEDARRLARLARDGGAKGRGSAGERRLRAGEREVRYSGRICAGSLSGEWPDWALACGHRIGKGSVASCFRPRLRFAAATAQAYIGGIGGS